MKENSLVNNEKDHVLLVLSKVPVQKCFSKRFLRWFVSDKLWYIIAKKRPITVIYVITNDEIYELLKNDFTLFACLHKKWE